MIIAHRSQKYIGDSMEPIVTKHDIDWFLRTDKAKTILSRLIVRLVEKQIINSDDLQFIVDDYTIEGFSENWEDEKIPSNY